MAISSCWALMIRSAEARTDGLAPCVGAQPAITMAWAWWPIIPVHEFDVRRGVGMRGAVGARLGDGRLLAPSGGGRLRSGPDRFVVRATARRADREDQGRDGDADR